MTSLSEHILDLKQQLRIEKKLNADWSFTHSKLQRNYDALKAAALAVLEADERNDHAAGCPHRTAKHDWRCGVALPNAIDNLRKEVGPAKKPAPSAHPHDVVYYGQEEAERRAHMGQGGG